MFNWKKILTGNNQYSSIKIKAEIESLINDQNQLKAKNAELESCLQQLQIELLADAPGALKAIKETEAEIGGNKNKISAISSVIEDLEKKLADALILEKENRQGAIISETALIDEQIAEIRLAIVEHFAKAAALYQGVTGNDAIRLNLDFFINYRLDDKLRELIAENSSDETTLYRKRENLSNEAIRLRKQPAS